MFFHVMELKSYLHHPKNNFPKFGYLFLAEDQMLISNITNRIQQKLRNNPHKKTLQNALKALSMPKIMVLLRIDYRSAAEEFGNRRL